MKTKTSILITATLLTILSMKVFGQSDRIRFRYHLTQSKYDELIQKGYGLKDSVMLYAKGTLPPGKTTALKHDSLIIKDMTLCQSNTIYCLITPTPTKGYLLIDPWSIITSPCVSSGSNTEINGQSRNALIITFPRKTIGDPVRPLNICYDTWLFNVNTLGVKFRPAVVDSNKVKHSAVAATSLLSLGVNFGKSWGFTSFNNRTNNSYSITLSGGLGFSSANISTEILTSHIEPDLGNELVLSPSINAIFARNDIGLTFAYGRDYMTGKDHSAWAYQGKHFIGIGLAAGLKL